MVRDNSRNQSEFKKEIENRLIDTHILYIREKMSQSYNSCFNDTFHHQRQTLTIDFLMKTLLAISSLRYLTTTIRTEFISLSLSNSIFVIQERRRVVNITTSN